MLNHKQAIIWNTLGNCLCAHPGASTGTVELLPAPSNSANWTVGLPTDNGHDSDQVFEFNGTQAIKVPEGVVSTTLKEPFTISVWMRHGPGSREKETILCNSDKTGNDIHTQTQKKHTHRTERVMMA